MQLNEVKIDTKNKNQEVAQSLKSEMQRSTFDFFVPFLTPLDTLTNSAMIASFIW